MFACGSREQLPSQTPQRLDFFLDNSSLYLETSFCAYNHFGGVLTEIAINVFHSERCRTPNRYLAMLFVGAVISAGIVRSPATLITNIVFTCGRSFLIDKTCNLTSLMTIASKKTYNGYLLAFIVDVVFRLSFFQRSMRRGSGKRQLKYPNPIPFAEAFNPFSRTPSTR
ncbi:unnamed protein product [Albugo candida]|uniref:Uncharacterized protein n=1 Tax=Albugo candida TaxID=65357 RepID=A0A024G9X0_9STRA|nr:unnamed protein product [Albugo candida]|eukprot:CCI43676.1 unnamed protein product [Albugo candida]